MKIHYIILNGESGSGKTTFTDMCGTILKEKGHKVIVKSSIDIVKEIAEERCGWNGEKDEKGRKLLHDLKVAMENYNNYPTLSIFAEVDTSIGNNEYDDNKDYFVFVDIREPEYIEKFKKIVEKRNDLAGCISSEDIVTLYLVKPGSGVDEVKELKTDIREYKGYNVIIKNDGDLSKLEKSAESFLKKQYSIEEKIGKYNCPDCKIDHDCGDCIRANPKEYEELLEMAVKMLKGGGKNESRIN